MKKRFALFFTLLMMCVCANAETYTIYVSDQTGWSTFYLYAWGDSEAFGKWPGATSAPVMSIEGTEYKLYTYSVADGKSSMTMNLISHNNVGENQPGDERQLVTLTIPADYCLQVTKTGISQLSVPTITLPEFAVDSTSAISKENRVIYEMNLYSFTSEGTLSAAQERLVELRRLGIDIVWLMPIYPRGVEGKVGNAGSPYAPKDFKAVNPDHGTLSDLKNFVHEAHRLGMSVWLDWVPNHTAIDHPWTTTHPEYYERVNGVIQHPNDYKDVYQLNYNSPELCNEMISAMKYWVDEADIDGYRCDYVSSPKIGLSFWQQAMPMLQSNSRSKQVEMLGEADFTGSGNSFLFSAGFDYDYAWGYADGLKSVSKGTSVLNAKSAAQTMLKALNQSYSQMSRMSYLTNHDDMGTYFDANYMTVLGDNVAPMTVMYFTFFGMPLIYNGQEIGATKIPNYFEKNSSAKIEWNTVNWRIKNTIRSLVALKHTQTALSDGKATVRASTRLLTTENGSVVAYEKVKDDNRVVVVISLSDKTEEIALIDITKDDYFCALNSTTIGVGCYLSPAETIDTKTKISLEPKGYRVYTNMLQPQSYNLFMDVQKKSDHSIKIIRNGHLYILRDGKTYNAQGARVE